MNIDALQVFIGRCEGTPVVIKSLLGDAFEMLDCLRAEATMLQILRHPNLVQLKGTMASRMMPARTEPSARVDIRRHTKRRRVVELSLMPACDKRGFRDVTIIHTVHHPLQPSWKAVACNLQGTPSAQQWRSFQSTWHGAQCSLCCGNTGTSLCRQSYNGALPSALRAGWHTYTTVTLPFCTRCG